MTTPYSGYFLGVRLHRPQEGLLMYRWPAVLSLDGAWLRSVFAVLNFYGLGSFVLLCDEESSKVAIESNSNLAAAPYSLASMSITVDAAMEQLQVLRENFDILSQREESLLKKLRNIRRRSMSNFAQQLDLMDRVSKEGQLNAEPTLHPCRSNSNSKRGRREFEEDDESMVEGRYMYFSDGFTISLLDLKQPSNNLKSLRNVAFVRPLPKMANLKLGEDQLPLFAGLLRLGSDVYMIGGQQYEDIQNAVRHSFIPFKGTSSMCYRLSLAPDAATLIPSKGNMVEEEMKTPKVWPIVEEIDGQIHVFDSAPLIGTFVPPTWVFNHEVLDREGRWSQIPTTGSPLDTLISSHVVLGNRIYAVTSSKFLVFDSKTRKWDACGEVPFEASPFGPWVEEHLSHILRKGFAKCVGEYPYRLSNRKLLYVVIGIVQPSPGFDQTDYPPYGVACLVTAKGKVVLTQELPRFFAGAVKLIMMVHGTIIKFKDGKTLCSVVNGHVKGGPRHIFINTFRVEMLPPPAPSSSSKGRRFKFVRVVVKDRHVYGEDPWSMDCPSRPCGVVACFL